MEIPSHLTTTESWAEYIGENFNQLKAEDQARGKDRMALPPPKPGEIITCQICGKQMLPEDFSDELTKKKWEFKWRCHWTCKDTQIERMEREVTGLVRRRTR